MVNDPGLTVNLVKEYDTGLGRPRFLKQHPELPFCFSNPLGEDIGAFTHEERCRCLAFCNGQGVPG